MAHKHSQDTQGSCSDGVRVKISEKYKPPPKINLAMTSTQRISLNNQLLNNMPQYNFKLEMSSKEKMQELRAARNSQYLNSQERLERLKSVRRKKMEEKKERIKELNSNNNHENYTSGGVLIPTQVNSSSSILTPIPLSNQNYTSKDNDKSPFNISDFEPDSSPFDNMELKTINDMEELKLVLQNEQKNYTTHPSHESNLFSYTAHSSTNYHPSTTATTTTCENGYFYKPQQLLQPNSYLSSSFDAPTPQSHEKESFRSAPDIIRALQEDLNSTHINHPVAGHSKTNNPTPNPETHLENPFETLSKELQTACQVISGMGFPIARVARACKSIGLDEKKILDHQLAMSELLDLGFAEEKVSEALLKCDNDRDKALEQLIL
ncbi:PREDICTED: ubiquitin-associated protein 1 [Nicrophorus vespilloides]|uniref:Ubiquitin-associated protein 1 n=1 Tax=Nicrophorus vespilloides TaxID=110193 RepID=A0ABM1M6X7_NICVS|nr:PREDICTED: ubiquitin-associated protein 1 [Nicrophorus vespilloides]